MVYPFRTLYLIFLLLMGASSTLLPRKSISLTVQCGTWEREETNTGKDLRIQVIKKPIEDDNVCTGAFTLRNNTGILSNDNLLSPIIPFPSGYTLELKVNSENGEILAMTPDIGFGKGVYLVSSPFELDVLVNPLNTTLDSKITVSGAMNIDTWAIDAGLFTLRAVSLPCVPLDKLLFAVIKARTLLREHIILALRGHSLNPLSGDLRQAVVNFSISISKTLSQFGYDCLIDLSVPKPRQLVALFIGWVGRSLTDIIKYRKQSADVSFAYKTVQPKPQINDIATVVKSIPIIFPEFIAVNPTNHRVYVTSNDSPGNKLYTIDGINYNVSAYEVDQGPRRIAINPNSGVVYLSYVDGSHVSVHDGDDLHLIRQITDLYNVREMSIDVERGILYVETFNNPNSVAWGRIYESTYNTDVGHVFDTPVLNSIAINPNTQHIYVATGHGLYVFKDSDILMKDEANFGYHTSIAIDPQVNHVYVLTLTPNTRQIVVYDDNNLKIINRYNIPYYAYLTYNSVNRHFYTIEPPNKLHILDRVDLQEISTVTIGVLGTSLDDIVVDESTRKVWLIDTRNSQVYVVQDTQ